MTVLPSVTWPSPANATLPLRRTPRMVVPCGSKCCESVIESSCVVNWRKVGILPLCASAAYWLFRPRGPGSGPTRPRENTCPGKRPLTGLLSRSERVLGLATGSGVRRVVNAGEVLEAKMGVDLGRGDIGVAQQLLHAAQLRAGLQQMRGER